jgi:hypothetical protein
VRLIVGAGRLDREIDETDELLVSYRSDDGLRYLDFEAVTPSDSLLPEDLAVTILINSRVGPPAFKSVQDNGHALDLPSLPDKRLEETNEDERQAVAEVVGAVAKWPGFAASVATKVLHKKRPQLIPILDNQAIFGAYMNSGWPQERSSMESIYAVARIREALDWMFFDLTRTENAEVWPRLEEIEPTRSRIELFDMVWWMYFRLVEPVTPQKTPV